MGSAAGAFLCVSILALPQPAAAQQVVPDGPAVAPPPSNTTSVPRSPVDPKAAASQQATQIRLVALLTAEGQQIDQGLVWRVFQDKAEQDGKSKLVATHRDASPVVKVPPGDYLINAAFGRASLTRRINVKAGTSSVEQFVLNAGGLRVAADVGGAEASTLNIAYSIYSDERDQFGNRATIMSGAKPGLIIRLNAGIYQIVSTYGDANATNTDDRVENIDATIKKGNLQGRGNDSRDQRFDKDVSKSPSIPPASTPPPK